MTAIFSAESTSALRAHRSKADVGCDALTSHIETLQKDLLHLSRQTVLAFDKDADVESRDLPIYDRQSTISQLDRAATELALTQGHVDVHTEVFDKVLTQVQHASDRLVQWKKTHKDGEEDAEGIPEDYEQEGEEDHVKGEEGNGNGNGNGNTNGNGNGKTNGNTNGGAAKKAPTVPDICRLYSTTLSKSLPEPTKKSRSQILKKSRDLKKYKETLLWELLPEIDLGDNDKWWISLGSLVAKHVNGDSLEPEPNGYNLSEDDSDDELFVSRKSNLKCPITRDYLENPVRAVVCKHLYSGDAFKEWLRSNQGRSKCPLAGCNNNLRKITDVEADESVVGRVKRLKRNAERKQKEKETLGTQRI